MLNDKSELINVVQSLLFVSGQGVEIKDIAEKLEVSEQEVKKTVDALKAKMAEEGINVITYKNSVQLCSNPKYAEDIATVLNPIREKLLTKSAIETMAIVAYKQPVTRLDIEQIRGVSSDYALQVLMNFKLVEVVGRKDAIGKPLLFGTTDEFLKRFELQNLNELPDYESLLERIAVLHKEVNDELYGSTKIVEEIEFAENDEEKLDKEEKEKEDETLSETTNEKSEIDLKIEDENSEEMKIQFSEQQTKEIIFENSQDDDFLDSKERDLL
ncbi:MAG: SMC-Scp complex subunit ScpB [Clostridia bacterium]|nr:SMC-Scp complex subunit ScpB [Clostridia bacterium]